MNRKKAKRAVSLTTYATTPEPPVDEEVPETVEPSPFWEGILGYESQLTGDGRFINEDALSWETPQPLRYTSADYGAHDGAVRVGRILSIWRGEPTSEGVPILAKGDFDLNSEVGREAARLVSEEMLNGVSMDLDSVEFEVQVAKEVIELQQAMWDAMENGEEPGEPELEERDGGKVVVYKGGPDDEVMVTTAARVRAATLVDIPAFQNAKINSVAPNADSLAASAAPVAPPADWFQDPQLTGPTALRIDDNGRVYGHLATWDTCHVADPSGVGICVMAPHSVTDYAYFHTGAVKCADGSFVSTGTLRFETSHAGSALNASSATAHYDNTGLAGADIHVGEDKHGIWVAGALRPGVTAAQIRTLRASPLSGDWRTVNGNLELVGALAVNLAGFPIPRTAGLVASGEQFSLVAAGSIAPEHSPTLGLSASDVGLLKKMIDRERMAGTRSLQARVLAAENRRKVAVFQSKRAIENSKLAVRALRDAVEAEGLD